MVALRVLWKTAEESVSIIPFFREKVKLLFKDLAVPEPGNCAFPSGAENRPPETLTTSFKRVML
jgi:hypothetical protein